MTQEQLKKIIEAALMVSGRPLNINQLLDLFDKDTELPEKSDIRAALTELQADYADRGAELKEVASGFRFQVKSEYAHWVNRLYDEGFEIIFFTARYMGRFGQDVKRVYDHGYEMTLQQLKRWGFKFHKLYLGKPSHHILVDDKALFYNPDWDAIYKAIKEKENKDIY